LFQFSLAFFKIFLCLLSTPQIIYVYNLPPMTFSNFLIEKCHVPLGLGIGGNSDSRGFSAYHPNLGGENGNFTDFTATKVDFNRYHHRVQAGNRLERESSG
jgi:hypothetical protein